MRYYREPCFTRQNRDRNTQHNNNNIITNTHDRVIVKFVPNSNFQLGQNTAIDEKNKKQKKK